VRICDPLGNEQAQRFDLLGRVISTTEPDGDYRIITHDREGNVTHIVDKLYDVRFEYSGMGRLASRTQAGTTVRFEYDTEERLTGVVNEHGYVFSFALGATGNLMSERRFDGLTQVYEYDVAGRVVSVRRPSGAITRYEYDSIDRVIVVGHSDGTGKKFAYRTDGALMTAENEACTVTFERDLLGRVVKEYQNDHWVASSYDALGRRVRMTTSLGADVNYEHDTRGDISGVNASFGGASWSATFARDALGQELLRHLPDGVQSRWHRDSTGRPVRHKIVASSAILHDKSYEWHVGGRLSSTTDLLSGPVRYEHDGLGQLVASIQDNGDAELRMPDAVGNLFATRSRRDREYGPAGQILSSIDKNGLNTHFTYDPEGNLAEKIKMNGEHWSYAWEAGGLLREVTRPDGRKVSFIYDALARRIAKKTGRNMRSWVWDGDATVHEWENVTDDRESSDFNSARPHRRRSLMWLMDSSTLSPCALLCDGEAASLLQDHVGMPISVSDLPGEAMPPPMVGQYVDDECGLHYNRFRYYDPSSGSYISADPLGLAGGLSLYSYVGDPTIQIDQFGLADRIYPSNLGSGAGRGRRMINPNVVRFSQDSIAPNFTNGQSVNRVARALRAGHLNAADFPEIRLVERNGDLYTIDNRRLVAFQKAGLEEVPFRMATPSEIVKDDFKFRTTTEGKSIRIRKGGGNWSVFDE
jgi:RHS repeat-associated protein